MRALYVWRLCKLPWLIKVMTTVMGRQTACIKWRDAKPTFNVCTLQKLGVRFDALLQFLEVEFDISSSISCPNLLSDERDVTLRIHQHRARVASPYHCF